MNFKTVLILGAALGVSACDPNMYSGYQNYGYYQPYNNCQSCQNPDYFNAHVNQCAALLSSTNDVNVRNSIIVNMHNLRQTNSTQYTNVWNGLSHQERRIIQQRATSSGYDLRPVPAAHSYYQSAATHSYNQEAADTQQAIHASHVTYANEQRQRAQAQAQEQADIARATAASHVTYAQEQNRRAAQAPPAYEQPPAYTQHSSAPPAYNQAQEDADMARAMAASRESYAQEQSRRAEAPPAYSNDALPTYDEATTVN